MNAIKAEDPSCRLSRSVNLYADGELEPNRSVEVEAHLSVCTSCREELELIRAMRRSLRRSTVRQPSKAFEERMRLVADVAVVEAEHAALNRGAGLQESAVLESASQRSTEDLPSSPTLRAVSAIPSQLVSISDLSSTQLDQTGDRKVGRARQISRRAFGRFRMSWGTAMAMAAAASFVVAFFATRTQRPDSVARMPTLKATSVINPLVNSTPDTDSFDELIDHLVSLHAHPIPAETKNFDEAVDRFNGTLGVGLDRHVLRQPFGANFNGARMHVIEFREPDIEPTAELRYTMQGHRITIYVFDPRRVPIGLTHLTRRVVRSAPVYVGRVRGFSVAASENTGVGYAMASDLDDDKSAQLVAEIQ